MPDRPFDAGRGGAGEPDGPEYGWLYGGRHSPEPTGDAHDAEAEHTRILPTAPRPTPGRSSAPPPPPLRTSGATTSGPIRPRRRRRAWPRVVLAVIVVWLVFLIAVPFWAWSKVDKVNAIPKGGPADQPGTNYLLVGSDSREGLTKAQDRKLGTGGVAVDGGRTDTIMVLHTGSGPNVLLSIPRDSLVPIPGHGTSKINAAFAYGGPKLLVQTIQQDTGLHIDHYVEIGLGGFVNIVDALGGVRICPHRAITDRRANLHVKKGCQTADGATALGWARSRHAFRLGDIDREEHQRQIVNQIGHKAKSPLTVLDPFRYYKLNKAASTSLKVSKGTGVLSMVSFAWAMGHLHGSSGMTCGMPIANLSVQWDSTRALQLLHYLKTDTTKAIPKALCTKSGLPK